MESMKVVSQEHPMGCAVACVASCCNLSYHEALQLFEKPEHAWTRGFYCHEIVDAFQKTGLSYEFSKFDPTLHMTKCLQTGTIVFISPNSRYPYGHFLSRLENGWMNPWFNCPQMIPVQSKTEEFLPGEISYIIYAREVEENSNHKNVHQ